MLESRIYKILEKYGDNIVLNIQRELRVNNNIATGNAINSLKKAVYMDVTGGNTRVVLNVIGANYIKALDEGRKPGKKGPSSTDIEKWIEAKSSFRLRDRRGRFKAKTKSNIKRAAFNIARSIGIKGTKPYNLLEYAVKPLESRILGEVVTAFVEEELNTMIKNKTLII